MFSKYDVYTTVQSIYCYPDSDVLKNKLNIKDRDKLKQADNRVRELETREPETVEVEVERVPDDVTAELERLRAELEKSRANDGEVTPVKEIEIKLRISWYQLTRGFEELLTLVAQLNQRDPDKGKNYAGAVMKLCDAMKAKVSQE